MEWTDSVDLTLPQPVESVRSVFLEFLQDQADKAAKMLAMAGGKASVAALPDGTFEYVQTSPIFDLKAIYTLAGDAAGTVVTTTATTNMKLPIAQEQVDAVRQGPIAEAAIEKGKVEFVREFTAFANRKLGGNSLG